MIDDKVANEKVFPPPVVSLIRQLRLPHLPQRECSSSKLPPIWAQASFLPGEKEKRMHLLLKSCVFKLLKQDYLGTCQSQAHPLYDQGGSCFANSEVKLSISKVLFLFYPKIFLQRCASSCPSFLLIVMFRAFVLVVRVLPAAHATKTTFVWGYQTFLILSWQSTIHQIQILPTLLSAGGRDRMLNDQPCLAGVTIFSFQR